MVRHPQLLMRLVRSLVHRVRTQVDPLQLEPWLIITCHYIGILLWTLLPSAVATWIFPSMVAAVILSPIGAIPLAVIVFDRRGYRRWVAGRHHVISVRILHAVSDGITWLSWCRRV